MACRTVLVALAVLAAALVCRSECVEVSFTLHDDVVFRAFENATRSYGTMPRLMRSGGDAPIYCHPLIIGDDWDTTTCRYAGFFVVYTSTLLRVTAEDRGGQIIELQPGRAYNICTDSLVAEASVSWRPATATVWLVFFCFAMLIASIFVPMTIIAAKTHANMLSTRYGYEKVKLSIHMLRNEVEKAVSSPNASGRMQTRSMTSNNWRD